MPNWLMRHSRFWALMKKNACHQGSIVWEETSALFQTDRTVQIESKLSFFKAWPRLFGSVEEVETSLKKLEIPETIEHSLNEVLKLPRPAKFWEDTRQVLIWALRDRSRITRESFLKDICRTLRETSSAAADTIGCLRAFKRNRNRQSEWESSFRFCPNFWRTGCHGQKRCRLWCILKRTA